MYNLVAKLTKNITRWGNGTITHENKLCIDSEECKTVQFEQIESFYKLSESRKILCPIGKYDPINLDNLKEITNNIEKKDNWELKCYNHNSGKVFFFAFYFMNGENQIYDLLSDNTYTQYEHLRLHREIYDFKLVNKNTETELDSYPMCALISWNNYIRFMATKYGLKEITNILLKFI